jgi:hypothetical protein
MSARASSETAAVAARNTFTRWPGILRLAVDVLGGPVFVLITQQVISAGNMWACGHNAKESLHIAPALCVIAVFATIIDSWMVWRAVGRGVEDEYGGADTRTRFLALVGIMVGAVSAAVILAQWFAIFMFAPCMRA